MIPELKKKIKSFSLRAKLLSVFTFFALIIVFVNLMSTRMVNHLTTQLEEVYERNLELNELDSTLSLLQASIDSYVSTKSTDSMEHYYIYEQQLRDEAGNLNQEIVDDELLLAEKNISALCDSYLKLASDTVKAKRGRNVEKYSELSESLLALSTQIHTYIYNLNNDLFKSNSQYYKSLNKSLRTTERMSVFALILVMLMSVIAVSLSTTMMVQPLNKLADSANQVAKGNFDIEDLPIQANDEVGVVTNAFNQMIQNIHLYIQELRETLERENDLKERELMMQSHLKDAQLKYLQAQINPHFLFNTLNAGAQLAMMEDAQKTGELLNNTAAFFRYNVRNKEDATIGEEVRLVENYIYICNVRFAGEILFEKDVDEALEDVKMPSMILQPLVENAFNYGIRNIDREGRIELAIREKNERVEISVWDNGTGMTAERIEEILHSEHPTPDSRSTSSNGVGIRNLKERLLLYFADEASLDIISEGENMGTEILITFPINKEE